MGLINTLDAANRYGENQSILEKVENSEIKYGSPEYEKQFDYFIRSNASNKDLRAILETAAKSLESNGIKVNSENLGKFFDSLVNVYMSQNNESNNNEEEHPGEGQAKNLDSLLEGLRDALM